MFNLGTKPQSSIVAAMETWGQTLRSSLASWGQTLRILFIIIGSPLACHAICHATFGAECCPCVA